MNEGIVLSKDKDGNYLVDLVGLLYLLKTEALAEGNLVYMIIDETEEMATYAVESSKNNYYLRHIEEKSLFELTPFALNATYLVDIEPTAVPSKAEYTEIHYEEALHRMKNGESVFLDTEGKASMQKCSKETHLSAEAILKGTWFITTETSKPKAKQKKKKSKTDNYPGISADTLFDRLDAFLSSQEDSDEIYSEYDALMAEFLGQQPIEDKYEEALERILDAIEMALSSEDLDDIFSDDDLCDFLAEGFQVRLLDMDDDSYLDDY